MLKVYKKPFRKDPPNTIIMILNLANNTIIRDNKKGLKSLSFKC